MNKKLVRNGAIATVLALSSVMSVTSFAQAATPSTVNATVNTASSLGVIPATALGVNTAVWDGPLTDPAVPGLLKNIHVAMLRYPGGSTSDSYHWATNTVDNGYANPNDNFDNFMKVAQQSGAQPIITVNGGDGTADEAAAWVKDANVTHNYGVTYWEIGNELYGNWETGNFANNPTGYAQKASAYIKAMKAVDPSIKIGVDLIAPGTGEDDWNQTVMSTLQSLGTLPDFGIVHWYALNPGGETDSGLLSSTDQIATMMSTLKQQLIPFGNVPVFVTETNSVSYNPGRQSTSLVNALFLADDVSNWLQGGAANVDWWDLYNGITTQSDGANVDPSLYGQYNYGDYGLLANASSKDGLTEPATNTPFPDYYGYQMVVPIADPGSTMVASGSDNNLVAVHSSVLPNGDLAVMLINKDPNNAYNVNLNLEGFQAAGSVAELTYGEGNSAVQATTLGSPPSAVQMAPYSITDIILQRAHGHQPQGPQLSDSTTVASTSIKPGYTQTVTTQFTDTRAELNNATLVVEIDNPTGAIVGRQVVNGVSLKPGQADSTPVTLNWTVPDIQGTYTVKAFAFSDNGAATYLADQSAGSFTVVQPDPPVISATVSIPSGPVKVGTPVTIQTTYTETSPTGYLTNGLLVQYAVYNNWTSSEQSNPSASLTPGQSITETWNWTPKKAGTYTFPEGIFTSAWKQLQWLNQDNVSLTVTN